MVCIARIRFHGVPAATTTCPMTYHLILGDRSFSSWSLRAWLLFERFGIPVKTRFVDFNDKSVAEHLADLPPARTVPTLLTDDGAVICESLAIAEELATRHPDAGLWPNDPLRRATARTLAAEMHSGFGALRNDCPMNLRATYSGFAPSDDVKADITRIEEIWAHARNLAGDGPWLLGDYSVADAFFAPVAARIAGYGLPVSPDAQAYVDTHLHDPAFRRWRAMGLVRGETLERYKRDYPRVDWPGPSPLDAKPVDSGPSENAVCPYSGDPVTHFMELDGRIFGQASGSATVLSRQNALQKPNTRPSSSMKCVTGSPE